MVAEFYGEPLSRRDEVKARHRWCSDRIAALMRDRSEAHVALATAREETEKLRAEAHSANEECVRLDRDSRRTRTALLTIREMCCVKGDVTGLHDLVLAALAAPTEGAASSAADGAQGKCSFCGDKLARGYGGICPGCARPNQCQAIHDDRRCELDRDHGGLHQSARPGDHVPLMWTPGNDLARPSAAPAADGPLGHPVPDGAQGNHPSVQKIVDDFHNPPAAASGEECDYRTKDGYRCIRRKGHAAIHRCPV